MVKITGSEDEDSLCLCSEKASEHVKEFISPISPFGYILKRDSMTEKSFWLTYIIYDEKRDKGNCFLWSEEQTEEEMTTAKKEMVVRLIQTTGEILCVKQQFF